MSRKAGWKGKIDHRQIPQLCGSCHSNPAFMRHTIPACDRSVGPVSHQRPRQAARGRRQESRRMHRLSQRPRYKAAQRSPFHRLPRQRGEDLLSLPLRRGLHEIVRDSHQSVCQYNISVHHEALVVRGDLSAPTCTTCHGDHGAVPPGVDKVQNVCANCHVFQAQMYAEEFPFQGL